MVKGLISIVYYSNIKVRISNYHLIGAGCDDITCYSGISLTVASCLDIICHGGISLTVSCGDITCHGGISLMVSVVLTLPAMVVYH